MTMHIERTGDPNIFKAESETSDKVYLVDLSDLEPHCACVNFAIQRNKAVSAGIPIPHCKHIKAVNSFIRTDRSAQQAVKKQEAEQAEAEFETIRAVGGLQKTLSDLLPKRTT